VDFTLYWFMFPVAIVVATCAMLSGIGGAALFTPLFILVFPLLGPEYVLQSTVAAISVALITQTFGFLSGFVGYYRRHLIDFDLAFRFLRIAVPVSVLGALTASLLHDGILIASYSLLVIVLAAALWLRPGQRYRSGGPQGDVEARTITDSRGNTYEYPVSPLRPGNVALTGIGAFLTGMVSVGIGEVTISQLSRRGVPVAVAAAASVVVVIVTILFASTTLAVQLVRDGGWLAIPWNLLIYDVPGVLIGGQIGPRLAGLVSQRRMQRSIAVLFVFLSVAMMTVALRKFGVA